MGKAKHPYRGLTLRTSSVALLLSFVLSACNQLPESANASDPSNAPLASSDGTAEFEVIVDSSDTSQNNVDESGAAETKDLAVGATVTTNLVTQASWDAATLRLRVRGNAGRRDSIVFLRNADTNFDLGSAIVRSDLSWRYEAIIRSSSLIPCSVRATTATFVQTVSVTNAPASCSVQTHTNQPPESTISSPATNVNIQVGQPVTFAGFGSDADANTPLTYFWDFAGAAPNSILAAPGSVVFNTSGTYTVTFTVKDSLGLADPTPASRTITVLPVTPPPPPPNQSPESTIILPSTNQTIQVGESVSFTGVGSDPDANTPLTYYWNFAGAAPNSTQASPGSVTFDTAGTYNISFVVTDSLGQSDPTPATRTITVAQANVNQPPDGQITAPSTNQSINVGQSVYFAGVGSDSDGNTPLTYLWNFDGAAANSINATPGNVVFNTPGTYNVRLTVTDARGLADASPAVRTITVNPVVTNQAPNGTITSPGELAGGSLVIYTGDKVLFSGSGTDPDGNTPLTYLWSFGGAASDSTLQNPGFITFNQAGTYVVSLRVTDSLGLSDASPAQTTISVIGAPTGSGAPAGTILSPATDLAISTGQTVTFSASATDPENNVPFHFHWSFDGAAPDVMAQNPGNVTFTRAGVYRVAMTVTDSTGVSDATPAVRWITVSDSNTTFNLPEGTILQPANNVTINVGSSVYFDGLATRPNGGQSTYFWNFAGAAPNSLAKTPGNIVFNNAGTYRVSLTVGDSLGWKDSTPAEVLVTVQAWSNLNQAPNGTIVSPVTDTVILQGDAVNFSGAGFDPDGTVASYRWDFAGGAANSVAQNPGNVVFNTAGTFVVKFTVSDNLGLADPVPAQRIVTVRPLSTNTLSPDGVISSPSSNVTITAGQTVYFSGSATDPSNATPFTYHWDFNGATQGSTAATPGNVTFANPGVYRVRLHVWNSAGLWDPAPAERVVTVTAQSPSTLNQPPNGTIVTPTTNAVINVGDVVNFSATGSDPESHNPLTYRWSFDGMLFAVISQNPGNVTFTEPGTYRVTMTVTDRLGASDPTPAERIITVRNPVLNNAAPTASITSPASNVTVPVNGTVSFAGSGNDPDGNLPLRYYWDFDGAMPNVVGQNPGSVTFPVAGIYHVTLRVIDSKGLSSQTLAERVVTVQTAPTNTAPIATIASPVGNQTVAVGSSLYFSGSATDAENNGPYTYTWLFNGAAPNSINQTPGYVTFYSAGVYTIQLYVDDNLGATSAPAEITVTVGGGGTANTPPIGAITSPTSDLAIYAGTWVYFSGTAYDADGDAVTYHWDMGGATLNSNLQTPGYVQFNTRGVYRIEMTVMDSRGAHGTPVIRTISVY